MFSTGVHNLWKNENLEQRIQYNNVREEVIVGLNWHENRLKTLLIVINRFLSCLLSKKQNKTSNWNHCIVQVIDLRVEPLYNARLSSGLLTANIYFIVNFIHLKMMKDKLSKAMFHVLDLCSWSTPGKTPTLESGAAPRCECVQLFKSESKHCWKKRRLSALQSFPAYRKVKKMVEAKIHTQL